jgi:hypothetical protein
METAASFGHVVARRQCSLQFGQGTSLVSSGSASAVMLPWWWSRAASMHNAAALSGTDGKRHQAG